MLLFVGFLAGVLGFEFRDQLFAEDSGSAEKSTGPFEATNYRLLTGLGYRAHRARTVRLVTLQHRDEGDEILGNLCTQRQFLSVVVENLLAAGVSGIVLDKHLGRGCGAADLRTEQLVRALTGSSVPITIGLHTSEAPHPNEDGPLELPHDVLFDPLNPPKPIGFGLIRFNRDTKKIPIEWGVSDGSKTRLFRTLAFEAAVQNDWRKEGEILGLLRGRHPYASFIKRDDVPTTAAARIYCLNPRIPFPDIACADFPADPKFDLRGKIALLGDFDSEKDKHSSVVGRVPGVFLHANYIEALLDDRYFIPMGHKLSVAMTIVISSIVQVLFWMMKKPERAALFCIFGFLALIAAGCVGLYLFQYVLPPVLELGSLLAFTVLRYFDARGHSVGAHTNISTSPTVNPPIIGAMPPSTPPASSVPQSSLPPPPSSTPPSSSTPSTPTAPPAPPPPNPP